MAERDREEGKTLEMRIAELENKLAGMTAGPAAIPHLSTIPQLCSSYCFCCVPIQIVVERSRGIAAQQALASGGAMTPFAGGFTGLGY
jgi:hypothetical protein